MFAGCKRLFIENIGSVVENSRGLAGDSFQGSIAIMGYTSYNIKEQVHQGATPEDNFRWWEESHVQTKKGWMQYKKV